MPAPWLLGRHVPLRRAQRDDLHGRHVAVERPAHVHCLWVARLRGLHEREGVCAVRRGGEAREVLGVPPVFGG